MKKITMKKIKYAIPYFFNLELCKKHLEESSHSQLDDIIQKGKIENHFFVQSEINYTTKDDSGVVEFNPMKCSGNKEYTFKRKPVYVSLELQNTIDNLNRRSNGKVFNAIDYASTLSGYEFIKSLDRFNLPIRTIHKQTIVELRPKRNNSNSHDPYGDIRLVGFEQPNGYFFTEITLHKGLNNTMFKVIACLAEGYNRHKARKFIIGDFFERTEGFFQQELQQKELEESLKKSVKIIAASEEKAKLISEEKAKLISEITSLSNQVKSNNENKKKLESEIKALEKVIESSPESKELELINSEITSLSKQISKYEEDNKKLVTKIHNKQFEIRKLNSLTNTNDYQSSAETKKIAECAGEEIKQDDIKTGRLPGWCDRVSANIGSRDLSFRTA